VLPTTRVRPTALNTLATSDDEEEEGEIGEPRPHIMSEYSGYISHPDLNFFSLAVALKVVGGKVCGTWTATTSRSRPQTSKVDVSRDDDTGTIIMSDEDTQIEGILAPDGSIAGVVIHAGACGGKVMLTPAASATELDEDLPKAATWQPAPAPLLSGRGRPAALSMLDEDEEKYEPEGPQPSGDDGSCNPAPSLPAAAFPRTPCALWLDDYEESIPEAMINIPMRTPTPTWATSKFLMGRSGLVGAGEPKHDASPQLAGTSPQTVSFDAGSPIPSPFPGFNFFSH